MSEYKSQYLTGSILNAIRVIRLLRRSHPLKTTAIAREVSITYDQAYRTLLTLESEGIAVRVAGNLWCGGDVL